MDMPKSIFRNTDIYHNKSFETKSYQNRIMLQEVVGKGVKTMFQRYVLNKIISANDTIRCIYIKHTVYQILQISKSVIIMLIIQGEFTE